MLTRLLAAGLLALPTLAAAGDLDALLRSVLATYGEEATDQLGRWRAEGEMTGLLRSPGTLRRDLAVPDQLRVEITRDAGTELRLLDGSESWQGPADDPAPADTAARLTLQFRLLGSCAPWTLARYAARLEDLGTRLWAGRQHRLLGLPWSDSLQLLFWIDASSRRVTRVDGKLSGRARPRELSVVYGDFRRVRGVLVPFSERTYANGRTTDTVRLATVTFAPGGLGPFRPARP